MGIQLIIAYKFCDSKKGENHIFWRQMIKHLNRHFSLSWLMTSAAHKRWPLTNHIMLWKRLRNLIRIYKIWCSFSHLYSFQILFIRNKTVPPVLKNYIPVNTTVGKLSKGYKIKPFLPPRSNEWEEEVNARKREDGDKTKGRDGRSI